MPGDCRGPSVAVLLIFALRFHSLNRHGSRRKSASSSPSVSSLLRPSPSLWPPATFRLIFKTRPADAPPHLRRHGPDCPKPRLLLALSPPLNRHGSRQLSDSSSPGAPGAPGAPPSPWPLTASSLVFSWRSPRPSTAIAHDSLPHPLLLRSPRPSTAMAHDSLPHRLLMALSPPLHSHCSR
jgi:hypothetical protein